MTSYSDIAEIPRGKYGVIYADPPWHFAVWAGKKWNGEYRKDGTKIISPARAPAYETMRTDKIASMPVGDLAADNCVLFMWTCWPHLRQSFDVIDAWGFEYKTCAFSWMKGDPFRLWADDKTPLMGLGYWTRANTEPCLLATRGKPKRLAADVRQGIIDKPREHSRKPDGMHERIERLVAGPYIELFARQQRPGWDCFGNETGKFDKPYSGQADFSASLNVGYEAIRDRVANGGEGWNPK